MPKRNHKAVRTCLGCGLRDGKQAMVRLAAQREGGVVADFDARITGRGGYLHPRAECLQRFVHLKVKNLRSLERKLDRNERNAILEAIDKRIRGAEMAKIK